MQYGGDLHKAGINYHAYGTIKNGRKVTAYFYKLNSTPTSEQMAKLREEFPHVSTGYGYSEFAPEQRKAVLIFPSSAELKRRGAAQPTNS